MHWTWHQPTDCSQWVDGEPVLPSSRLSRSAWRSRLRSPWSEQPVHAHAEPGIDHGAADHATLDGVEHQHQRAGTGPSGSDHHAARTSSIFSPSGSPLVRRANGRLRWWELEPYWSLNSTLLGNGVAGVRDGSASGGGQGKTISGNLIGLTTSMRRAVRLERANGGDWDLYLRDHPPLRPWLIT